MTRFKNCCQIALWVHLTEEKLKSTKYSLRPHDSEIIFGLEIFGFLKKVSLLTKGEAVVANSNKERRLIMLYAVAKLYRFSFNRYRGRVFIFVKMR